MSATLELDFVLAEYPHTAALRRGDIRSDRVRFRFFDFATAPDAFKRMVRQHAFGLCEMAIVTHLQAKAAGLPFALIPVTTLGRFPLNQVLCRADRTDITPERLNGLRIGVRSWSKTTCVWLRGILADEYGLELGGVRWLTFEGAHVPDAPDPTERAPAGRDIMAMLIDGEIDAAIGEQSRDSRLRMVFPDPEAAGRAWYEKHRIAPINHMIVMKPDLAAAAPWLAGEVYDLLGRSREAANLSPAQRELLPFGVEAARASLDKVIGYAMQQKILTRPFAVDELFDTTLGIT